MAPILSLLQNWIHDDSGNPYINKEKYALMHKKTFKLLDQKQMPTMNQGHWVSDPKYLHKDKDTLIVSNKMASKDSKFSMELLPFLAYLEATKQTIYWKKQEAPDFVGFKENGDRVFYEVTSTTSKNTWKMKTDCFLKQSKKKTIADSICIINKQIIKAMQKKNAKILNYKNNTGTNEGVLIIHLSSLSADVDRIISKGIDLSDIMPPNVTDFNEVFWIDNFANYGLLKNIK